MESIFSFNEVLVRLPLFLGIFFIMAIYEVLAPRRHLIYGRSRRWVTNFSIVVLDSLIIRVLFPAAAVGVALWADVQSIGLFHWLATIGVIMPEWITGLICFILLDFVIWAQHVAFHKIPLFWQFHKVHHCDPDIDVTTAIRFHPVEIVLSMLIKSLIILILGAPAFAVFIFEVALNGAAMFNHSNIAMPLWLERLLRAIIVTPDMHRVHHSVRPQETDSNYGFNFSFWDRLFRTYKSEPEGGQTGMTIGLAEYQNDKPLRLGWVLWLPFQRFIRAKKADREIS